MSDQTEPLASAPKCSSTQAERSITLTGRQLRTALAWVMPDPSDWDSLDTEVTIAWCDDITGDEDEPMPAGYVLWFADYPEEGCLPLDVEDCATPPMTTGVLPTQPEPAAKPGEGAARSEKLKLLADTYACTHADGQAINTGWPSRQILFAEIDELCVALDSPPVHIPIGTPMTQGVDGVEEAAAWHDVLAERRRQMESEGWTAEHDDHHPVGDFERAAATYLLYQLGVPGRAMVEGLDAPCLWPWDWQWLKPKGTRRDLVRAAALTLAAIEKYDREWAERDSLPSGNCRRSPRQ